MSINPRKALLDLGRLATATILPASSIIFMARDIANAWSGPDVKPELSQTSNEISEDAQEQEPCPKTVTPKQPTAQLKGGIEGKGLLALGVLASSVQCAHSQRTADGSKLIHINDTNTLARIGVDDDYPLSGSYLQTADIIDASQHQSIGNNSHPFTGKYLGQCHKIGNLSDCLINTLEGRISDLDLIGAKIISTKTTGLAACNVKGTVSGIRARNVHISTSGSSAHAGIGGGWVGDGGRVVSTTAVDSSVKTGGWKAYAGIGGGWVDKGGTVASTTAVNSSVKTTGPEAHAGIGGGWVGEGGRVASTTAVNSNVETHGIGACAGIGGGVVRYRGEVASTTAFNSTVMTKYKGSQSYANAGIGGGEIQGTVVSTTAFNSSVETLSWGSRAGIGGGEVGYGGTVSDTTAVNSTVKTKGYYADVGIGGGWVRGGRVVSTTAVNSRGETLGWHAHVGIGGGRVRGTVDNTMAVNSAVKAPGYNDAHVGIGRGLVEGRDATNTMAVNSYANGNLKNFSSISNDQLLCQNADPRVLAANCSSRTEFPDTLDLSYSDVCPVNTATASTASTASAASMAGVAAISLAAAGGLAIVGFTSHQWITGYRGGLRGPELVMKPLTRVGELARAAVNSVSQCVQEARERMNRQGSPSQEPAHEMSQV